MNDFYRRKLAMQVVKEREEREHASTQFKGSDARLPASFSRLVNLHDAECWCGNCTAMRYGTGPYGPHDG